MDNVLRTLDIDSYLSTKAKADNKFAEKDYKLAAHYYSLCRQRCELKKDFLSSHLRLIESIILDADIN